MESWQAWLSRLSEQQPLPWANALLLCLLSFFIGWLLARLFATRRIARLQAELELEQQSSEERIAGLENSFAALSAEALRDNNQSFLQLAGEVFGRHYAEASHGLQVRETAIDSLVQPLRDALKNTHEQLTALDKNTSRTQGELSGHIRAMSDTQAMLHKETRHLAHALRRPEVRGQWGEITLKRLLELSGMSQHADFTEQHSVQTGEGLMRPDLIVNLPNDRQIVVDVKTPLDAYLDAFGSEEDAQRDIKLSQHAGQVKKHIQQLSQKQYWAQFDKSPDFVVMFIPGDQFLAAALEQQADLIEYALTKKIVLATPTSLVALLRVIAHGWQQSELDEQSRVVRELAVEFDNRLQVFSRHFSNVGRDLERAVETYNQTVGSYERKVRPISRKFARFNPQAEHVEAEEIETRTRIIKQPD